MLYPCIIRGLMPWCLILRISAIIRPVFRCWPGVKKQTESGKRDVVIAPGQAKFSATGYTQTNYALPMKNVEIIGRAWYIERASGLILYQPHRVAKLFSGTINSSTGKVVIYSQVSALCGIALISSPPVSGMGQLLESAPIAPVSAG